MDPALLMKDAQVLLQTKQYDTAVTLFQKIIAFLDEDNNYPERTNILCEAYNNIGFILYKKVEFHKAVENYNKSIKLNSSYGIAYYNRGTIYYRLGLYEAAMKDLQHAVLLEPDNKEFKTGLEECKYALELTAI